MKPSDYLKRGWCQLASARDADGTPCFPGDPDAVAWCLSGAIREAILAENLPWDSEYIDWVKAFVGGREPSYYNDKSERTQAEVVALAEEVERRMGL
jgi:hypothetical protein